MEKTPQKEKRTIRKWVGTIFLVFIKKMGTSNSSGGGGRSAANGGWSNVPEVCRTDAQHCYVAGFLGIATPSDCQSRQDNPNAHPAGLACNLLGQIDAKLERESDKRRTGVDCVTGNYTASPYLSSSKANGKRDIGGYTTSGVSHRK